MSIARREYERLAAALSSTEGVVAGQMFGKVCLKIHGKAFVAQQDGLVVFKLQGADHEAALALPGARLWDPSGRGRPMKEWVAIPADEPGAFDTLAAAALRYVGAG